MKVISVENVSKKFMLAHDRPKNLADATRSVFKRGEREEFWALKDVSFEVEQGEALGIIGHNGAGKSTMLKLLTRIMKPTSGRIRTRGRVSALIEVGAGFHPEMTGRENIYLNGSILGMSRREIDKKLDDIVSFAELEKFIDTPVKRYSSGMYARLGFAVAAHVEPELLLVDEVLSVGDEQFQLKCQKHMSFLIDSGTTIMFVSHNLPAVNALCPRCIVLDKSKCFFDGNTQEAISLFRRLYTLPLESTAVTTSGSFSNVQISSVRILDDSRCEVEEIKSGSPLVIEINGVAYDDMNDLNCGIEILRADGIKAYDVNGRMDNYFFNAKPGSFTLSFEIPRCNLTDGLYAVSVGIMDRNERIHYHSLLKCAFFAVKDIRGYRGIARLGHNWKMIADDSDGVTE